MELLLTAALLETALVTASSLEVTRRRLLLRKWIRGEMSLEELKHLKRQPWFQRGFKPVAVEAGKKEN